MVVLAVICRTLLFKRPQTKLIQLPRTVPIKMNKRQAFGWQGTAQSCWRDCRTFECPWHRNNYVIFCTLANNCITRNTVPFRLQWTSLVDFLSFFEKPRRIWQKKGCHRSVKEKKYPFHLLLHYWLLTTTCISCVVIACVSVSRAAGRDRHASDPQESVCVAVEQAEHHVHLSPASLTPTQPPPHVIWPSSSPISLSGRHRGRLILITPFHRACGMSLGLFQYGPLFILAQFHRLLLPQNTIRARGFLLYIYNRWD